MQKQSFSLENVHCSACEAKVIKTLSQLRGVQEVSVNVLRKTMQVTFQDEKLGVAGIVSAMQQAGFAATPTRFTAHIPPEVPEVPMEGEKTTEKTHPVPDAFSLLQPFPMAPPSALHKETPSPSSSESQNETPPSKADVPLQEQAFLLSRAHCASCQGKIHAALLALDGIKEAHVNTLSKSIVVRYDAKTVQVQDIVDHFSGGKYAMTAVTKKELPPLIPDIAQVKQKKMPKNKEAQPLTAATTPQSATDVIKKERADSPLVDTTSTTPEKCEQPQEESVENNQEISADSNKPSLQKEEFSIGNVHCMACSAKVEKLLLAIAGIEHVAVNVLRKTMQVTFDTAQVSITDIRTAMEKAGYTATKIEKFVEIFPSMHTTSTTPEKREQPQEKCVENNQEISADSNKPSLQKEEFSIGNVHCTACSAKVEKLLLAIAGIEHVAVNVLRKTMQVTFDTAQVSITDIHTAMEKAGYTAEKVQNKEADAAVQLALLDADSIKEEGEQGKESIAISTPNFLQKLPLSLCASLGFAVVLMYVAMAPMFSLPLPLFLDMVTHPFSWAMAQCLLTMIILCIHRRIFTSGFQALLQLSPNMDSLVGLGSATAALFGVYALIRMYMAQNIDDMATVQYFANNLYFDSAGMILALIGLGKHFESMARERTGSAIDALMRLTPPTAIRLKDGEEVVIPTSQVQKGDVLVVHAGQSLAADGIIIQGHAFIDTSAITGESLPQEKNEGDAVIGATICQSGYFHMQVTKAGAESTLAHIIELVESATASKAPIARLADRISAIFVPIIIGIAVLSLVVWLLLGADFEFALSTAISVLVISCPCALGLATPTAIMVGMGMGAEHGILFKSAAAIERMQSIDTVVLDKTGTLTHGKPVVTDIYPYIKQEPVPVTETGQQLGLLDVIQQDSVQRSDHDNEKIVEKDATPCTSKVGVTSSARGIGHKAQENITEEALLYVGASIEKLSEHPLGQAIVREAKAKNVALAPAESYTNFKQMPGLGIVAEQDGKRILAGNARLLTKENISNPLVEKEKELARQGKTVLYFVKGTTLLGLIAVADTVKENSKEAVRDLKKLGMTILMLTGDNALTAKAVQEQVDIENILAEVLPQEKEEKVQQLQAAGHKVIMVGDGINDAPALARAQVGIAVGQGTDIALQSSDIVLMQSDVRHVAQALVLSKAVMRTIKQNLFWAFAYNSILIPVAAGVFYTAFGLTLNPMLAAASMSLSSLTVVGNALRLRMQSRKIF